LIFWPVLAPSCSPFVLADYDTGYYHDGYDAVRAVGNLCSLLSTVCSYAAFVCLVNADMLLRESAQTEDAAGVEALKKKAGTCFLAAFGLMSVPALVAVCVNV
jgi:hypothetical protein